MTENHARNGVRVRAPAVLGGTPPIRAHAWRRLAPMAAGTQATRALPHQQPSPSSRVRGFLWVRMGWRRGAAHLHALQQEDVPHTQQMIERQRVRERRDEPAGVSGAR